jgi:hypothetical protein
LSFAFLIFGSRLAYFDLKHTFHNKQQLQNEIAAHYKNQFVRQLYVLVLGLEVLGNPYGLVVDLASGVQDFFYQPFQVSNIKLLLILTFYHRARFKVRKDLQKD